MGTTMREQKETQLPMGDVSAWKQSKKCQMCSRLKRHKNCHYVSRIVVVKVDRDIQQGYTIQVIIIRMNKPVQKSDNFSQRRSCPGASTGSMSARQNSTVAASGGSASCSSTGHDGQ